MVLEEGFEIGTPEHCGGLVSKKALNELGVELSTKSFDSKINTAKIFSSDGKHFKIDSTKQQIVVVNRRELDKQIARQAKDAGATILVKTSFQGKIPNGVSTSNGDINCKYFIDCRGVTALATKIGMEFISLHNTKFTQTGLMTELLKFIWIKKNIQDFLHGLYHLAMALEKLVYQEKQ